MSRYPWYDSRWLETYADAKAWIARHRPSKLPEFERGLAPLRTDPGFETRKISRVFDAATHGRIRETIEGLGRERLELHEVRDFGRFIVHDIPYFTELQNGLTDLVSDAVGERVEPCYNFLSLYTKAGSCAPHMDAPMAKWTLDVCIDQSAAWPIHFSQVVDWPDEDFRREPGWEERIKRDPHLHYSTFSLLPSEAVIFSGSSQWHFRDRMPTSGAPGGFCNLLFFHYFPAGMRELCDPANWHEIFDVPELASFAKNHRD